MEKTKEIKKVRKAIKQFETSTDKSKDDSANDIKRHLEILRANSLFKVTKKTLSL